jgi:NAD-dependent deacetylase
MMNFPEALVTELRNARRVVAVTGAGISAESGVPTFRDAQTGLWARYDPADLATPEAFQRNPRLVWEWYGWRREKVLSACPNAGHRALANMQTRFAEFCLVTQNVDDLHQQAGSHPIIELHGSIMRARCFEFGHVAENWPDHTTEVPPRCRLCNSPMRPDVVWFGESLPAWELEQAMNAARSCDVLLSIGTSSVVYPAAGISQVAIQSGATVIEINPDETPLSQAANYVLRGPSGEILPALVDQLGP